jgi:hypothetical protein
LVECLLDRIAAGGGDAGGGEPQVGKKLATLAVLDNAVGETEGV